MPDYRRYFVPGGTYFFTIVTYRRRRLFDRESSIQYLREALADVKQKMPFEIQAAVILPDHLHFVWSLPPGDNEYPKRIGLMKVKCTRLLRGRGVLPKCVSSSRRRHHESDVWQRRFWEHTIDDEDDLERYLDYVHYNPVKHGYVSCPHMWQASSFHQWVRRGVYGLSWGCCCNDRRVGSFDFSDIEDNTGE